MDRPNWLLDMPADEYHAATKRNEYTTSHRLNTFRRCPQLYKKTIDGEIVEGDTAAFALGRATHVFILEGQDRFNDEFVVSDGPVNEKTGNPYGKATKAYQEWLAVQTVPVISSEDFALISKMSDAVHAHEIAADMLSQGFAEGTLRATWNGVPCQSRLDWFDPERGLLLDLKTCADVDRFPRYDVRDFGYVTQMAFYKKLLDLNGYETKKMKTFLLAVEKKEPFRCAVVEISGVTLDLGNEAFPQTTYGAGNELMIDELKICQASNTWPTRYEEIVRI